MRGMWMWAGAGAVALAGALAACGGQRAVVRDFAKWSGWYVSDTLTGGVRPRVLWLQVRYDTAADVALEFVGAGTTHHPGWWLARGNELTVQPTLVDGTPNELPFRWRLEGGKLVPLTWDHSVYGDKAVTLTKLVAPARAADSTAGARR